MKKIKQLILLATLLFAASSCIHEGAEDCIYTLRFKYDYNMDFVDKFAQQAQTLHLFVFDENDLFVTQLERSGDELKSSQVEFNLATEDHGKTFTFLAWVGIDNFNIISTDPVVGETTLHEMEVALNIESRAEQAFEPLMVGELSTTVQPDKVDVISLIKNTNKFRISLRLDPKAGGGFEPLKAENYNIY
ncbi:MAG: FimB/Mfa2 family fimbrial subunit, partial [Bacteroides sp.]